MVAVTTWPPHVASPRESAARALAHQILHLRAPFCFYPIPITPTEAWLHASTFRLTRPSKDARAPRDELASSTPSAAFYPAPQHYRSSSSTLAYTSPSPSPAPSPFSSPGRNSAAAGGRLRRSPSPAGTEPTPGSAVASLLMRSDQQRCVWCCQHTFVDRGCKKKRYPSLADECGMLPAQKMCTHISTALISLHILAGPGYHQSPVAKGTLPGTKAVTTAPLPTSASAASSAKRGITSYAQAAASTPAPGNSQFKHA